ncbi:hypothetical protein L1787_05340 [Acuticoccus sp. M5D2P5]|uniref:hypothetical protein n=1 Tax=Acuticoccus kalidii TaxID=2910977 RepID=UPI001F1D92F9|nr:hypothetical protein [Acuticoccus kalidii]MCF3932839.1 hypothetical protein [Acuticoccus kalidii]
MKREEPPRAPPEPIAPERTDLRTIVAVGGPLLFTPTALALAQREWTVFGVPSLVIYVFAAWLLGILLTRLLNRGMRD